mmetsp:Transcript_11851/g.22557  ORF Transcript_11851/g.22557 Transcript_11851/m.22557 type:complete len:214 (+) Transcript_11851:1537-2178(+)
MHSFPFSAFVLKSDMSCMSPLIKLIIMSPTEATAATPPLATPTATAATDLTAERTKPSLNGISPFLCPGLFPSAPGGGDHRGKGSMPALIGPKVRTFVSNAPKIPPSSIPSGSSCQASRILTSLTSNSKGSGLYIKNFIGTLNRVKSMFKVDSPGLVITLVKSSIHSSKLFSLKDRISCPKSKSTGIAFIILPSQMNPASAQFFLCFSDCCEV